MYEAMLEQLRQLHFSKGLSPEEILRDYVLLVHPSDLAIYNDDNVVWVRPAWDEPLPHRFQGFEVYEMAVDSDLDSPQVVRRDELPRH